jgi:hypothetical protein
MFLIQIDSLEKKELFSNSKTEGTNTVSREAGY